MPTSPFATRFSISDLENLSGVKAHTIRVWERRYGLIRPARTDTNIRHYSVEELRDLLNIAYLNTSGVKISKIAAMTNTSREEKVRELANVADAGSMLKELVMSMLHFDEARFEDRCNVFSMEHGFRELAEGVFLPFMMQVGLLWQSRSIRPAHEHFASNLVRRRLEAETRSLTVASGPPTHILYLREFEVHELGLLYANYLLRSAGKHVIYLGQSVPLGDLVHLASTLSGPLVMVTVLTSNFDGGTDRFLSDLGEHLGQSFISHWLTGPSAVSGSGTELPLNVRVFGHFTDMVPLLLR
ncbi:MAG: MerR family transcriptional regulator [Flavobacteriales bacterium]|nr:MAG: MerR family transcriptional regulator [Flavobacteriales bacterium]